MIVSTCSGGFKNFLQNFGDLSQFWGFWWFWYRLQNFEKSLSHCVTPILGQILENFDFRILVESQSYDKRPWRNFDFWSNFVEIEIILDFRVKDFKFCDFVKFCDFRVKDLKYSIFVTKFSSKFKKILIKKWKFCVSRVKDLKFWIFARVKDFKFHKFAKIQNFTKITKFSSQKNS